MGSSSPESHYSMLASLFLVNTTHISMGALRSGVGEASQQLSMFGNVLFRNVAENLLWWLELGRPHNCGEMTRCEEVQKHVFYSSQWQIPVFLPFVSHEQQNCELVFNETIDWTHANNYSSVLNMTDPAYFPDGWRVWFVTAICWGFDASDPRVSSLKEAILSTDIIFPNIWCDAKKWKCESVRTSYWIHTWGKSRFSRCLLSFQALNRGYCRHVVKGSWLCLPACVRI